MALHQPRGETAKAQSQGCGCPGKWLGEFQDSHPHPRGPLRAAFFSIPALSAGAPGTNRKPCKDSSSNNRNANKCSDPHLTISKIQRLIS